MRPAEKLLTITETAEMLGMRKTYLAYLRKRGTGPSYVQFSARNIRYRLSDVVEFQHRPKLTPSPRSVHSSAALVNTANLPTRMPVPKPLGDCTRCGRPDIPVLKTGKCLCSACITDIKREQFYGTDGQDLWTGKCHICCCELYMGGRAYQAGVRLAMLDHCHASGVVRGWLCQRCNVLLGKLKDNPQLLKNAVAYLTRTGMFS